MTEIIDNRESGRKPRRRLKDEKQPENNFCIDAYLESKKPEENNKTMAQRDSYMWCSSFRKILTDKLITESFDMGKSVVKNFVTPLWADVDNDKDLIVPIDHLCTELFHNKAYLYEEHESYRVYYFSGYNSDTTPSDTTFSFARLTLPLVQNEGFWKNPNKEQLKYIENLEQDVYNLYFFFPNEDGSISDKALFVPMLKSDARVPKAKKGYSWFAFTATLKKFPTLEITYEQHSQKKFQKQLDKKFQDYVWNFGGSIW